MALTRVQTGSGGTTSGTASVTFGAVPAVGDLMVAAVVVLANNVMTGTNGWASLTQINQGTNRRIGLFWKVAVAGDTGSVTSNICTFTSVNWGSQGDIWNASTGWPVSPANGENSQAVASATAYTTPSITPTITGRESVVVTSYDVTAITRTWSAEAVSGANVGTITEVWDSNGAAYASGPITSATGSYQGSATVSGVAITGLDTIAIFTPLETPELMGRPYGLHGQQQMHQLLSQ